MDTEIVIEVYSSFFFWKFNHKFNKIPCSFQRKSKQQNKICGISKHDLWFSITKCLQLFLLFPKECLKMKSFPQELTSYPSPIIMIKNLRETKFKPLMFHDQSLF